MAKSSYSEEFKVRVAQQIESGVVTQREVSRKLGIPTSTLCRWGKNGTLADYSSSSQEARIRYREKQKELKGKNFGELFDLLTETGNQEYALRFRQEHSEEVAERYMRVALNPSPTPDYQRQIN